MDNLLRNLSSAQLRRALAIREKIEALEAELSTLGLGESTRGKSRSRAVKSWKVEDDNGMKRKSKKVMSAAARARIGAAQKARWAKVRAAEGK